MVIKPTVGRKVWFHPGNDHPEMNVINTDQPLDATVLYVHDDNHVNLLVVDHMGHPHYIDSAWLSQPSEEIAPGCHAEWMPYQVDQVRKNTAYENSKVSPSM